MYFKIELFIFKIISCFVFKKNIKLVCNLILTQKHTTVFYISRRLRLIFEVLNMYKLYVWITLQMFITTYFSFDLIEEFVRSFHEKKQLKFE